MYGFTDDITVMAMVPYVRKSMDHITGMGVEFTTESEGFGDVRAVGGYDLFKSMDRTLKVTLGLSAPTGSTDERDDTPAGANQLLPYPMQIGSGRHCQTNANWARRRPEPGLSGRKLTPLGQGG